MAVEARYKAIVSVTDLASGPLRQINERIEALALPSRLVGDRFAAMSAQMSRFSNNIGLTQVARSVGGVASSVGNLVGRLTSTAAPWAGILGVAATAGLAKLTVDVAAAADELGELSMRTGLSVEQLQVLQAQTSKAGVETSAMTGAIQRLNRGLSEAASGKNKELAEVFAALRIDPRGVRNAADLLPRLADAFQRLDNPMARTRLSMLLFGRAGESLLPMLVQGRGELDATAERLRQFGYVMDRETVARVSAANDQFENLQMATRGLGTAIGVALAPVLGPIAEDLAKWVTANREWIATGIATKVDELATALRNFDWAGFSASLGKHITQIGEWVDAVGGIKGLLIGFGVLAAAPFIASLVSIGLAVGKLTFNVGALLFSLGRLATVAPAALAGGAGAAGATALAARAAAAGSSVATQAGPTVARAGLLARMAPGAAALGRFAGPIGAAITLSDGLALLGQQRDQTGERTRQGLRNLALRSQLRGVYGDTPAIDPDDDSDAPRRDPPEGIIRRPDPAEGPIPRPRLPSMSLRDVLPSESLVARDQPQQPGPGGQVDVHVVFDNLPAGARATATTSGLTIAPPTLELGYAFGTIN